MEFKHLSKYNNDLFLCARCGDCSLADKTVASNRDVFHPCAVKNVLGFEAYTSRGRVMIMNDLISGELEAGEDIVDWAYTCTTCRNCQETCTATAEGIRLPDMMEALRQDLFEGGHVMEKHGVIEDSIRKENNPYKEPAANRLELFGDREWSDKAEVVYFVGCTGSYREKQIAQDTVTLLDKIGLGFTVIPDEKCCGSVLLRLGRTEAFVGLTEDNIEAIKKTGAKTVVTACAGCFRTWKVDVPAENINYPFEVLHITEYLDLLVRDGKVAFSSPQNVKVTYHDPCHLGRHAEVYEAPRRVVEAVENIELIEMETNKRYAHCCGSGGGVKTSCGDLADEISADRIEEAIETGAELLVTACPFCHKGLEDGAEFASTKMPVLDLPSFLLPYVKDPKDMKKVGENPLKKQFMEYLSKHPLIFDGLKKEAVIDYEIGEDRFHVEVVGKREIEVHPIRAENPDVVLTFAPKAVEKLTTFEREDDYAAQFGLFFKEPTDDEWIKFDLRRNIVKLLMKGYRKFAQKAGLI
ncbi:MAG: heterodisulfide reductase-related iron-sulfur binding cluster [Candidatus Thorarchaeota archaeon]|jgi:heterodisulfide reductase subunit D